MRFNGTVGLRDTKWDVRSNGKYGNEDGFGYSVEVNLKYICTVIQMENTFN